jgi:hypothetical protein
MAKQLSRRRFILAATTGSLALATGNINRATAAASFLAGEVGDDLYSLSQALSATWADRLFSLPGYRLPATGDRIFNFVPGLEAVPFAITAPTATVVLRVLPNKV